MSRRDDIKNLIIAHERRLQKLKEQKARFGLETPPHILTEIEDIEAELERLHTALELSKNMSADEERTFFEFADKTENKFGRLHKQLKAWKNVHNLLQDTQAFFSPCRRFIFMFSKPVQVSILYDIEMDWRFCRRSLRKLEPWADNIGQLQLEMEETGYKIGQSEWLEDNPKSRQILKLWSLAIAIDKALNESNAVDLPEYLSDFGDLVDQLLFRADKKLLDIVDEMRGD